MMPAHWRAVSCLLSALHWRWGISICTGSLRTWNLYICHSHQYLYLCYNKNVFVQFLFPYSDLSAISVYSRNYIIRIYKMRKSLHLFPIYVSLSGCWITLHTSITMKGNLASAEILVNWSKSTCIPCGVKWKPYGVLIGLEESRA